MSSMYKGQILEFKEPEYYDDDLDRSDLVWKVCCAVCYDSNLQQKMLLQTSFSSLIEICISRVVKILDRMAEE